MVILWRIPIIYFKFTLKISYSVSNWEYWPVLDNRVFVIRFPARSTISSPVQRAQTGSTAIQPPRGSFPRLSSAEFRNAWSCASIHSHAFKKCSGTLCLFISGWHSVVVYCTTQISSNDNKKEEPLDTFRYSYVPLPFSPHLSTIQHNVTTASITLSYR
jgi:hypothetical protein